MASTIGMKSTMRRSKSSLHKQLSEMLPSSSGQTKMDHPSSQRFSPMLCTQGSFEQTSSPCFSSTIFQSRVMQRQGSSLSSSTLSVGSSHAVRTDSSLSENGSTIVHWGMFLALVLQVPNILKEIHLIVELHYHSFPLLIIIGSLPSILKTGKRPQDPIKDTKRIVLDVRSCSLHSSEWYRADSSSTVGDAQYEPIFEIKSNPLGEDWGHFADLDEGSSVERAFITAESSRRSKLATLQETEEEEE